MISFLSRYLFRFVGFLLVLTFTLSLFWCGDPDCLAGKSNEDCPSLVCSFLDKHDTSSSDASSPTKDCSCVCHIPSLSVNATTLSYYPALQQGVFELTLAEISSPSHSLFRPPIAS